MNISLPQINEIKEKSEKGIVRVTGCVPSQKESLIYELGDGFNCKVIIAFDEQKAIEIQNNYSAFDRDVYYYPAKDPMFDKADIRGTYLSQKRLEIIKKLFNKEKLTFVTTLDAFYEQMASFETIKETLITIKTGETINEDELAAALVEMGYENEFQISGHGQFSIRGNIIDVFPYTEEAPYRIDLFGDDVESIKMFDTESQRSIDSVDSFTIFPGADAKGASLFDYFDENTLIIFDEPDKIFRDEADLKIIEKFQKHKCIQFSIFDGSCQEMPWDYSVNINARNIPSYNGRFNDLVEDLKKYKKNGWTVYLYTANNTRAQRLVKTLAENDVEAKVMVGAIRAGFEYPDIKFSIITEVDIFGSKKVPKKKRRKYSGDPIKDFSDLRVGDYVVHEQHGVGIYKGIERLTFNNSEKDYMKIQYANNANLYVLATQFDKIQKYSSADGARPKIHRLGGKDWENTKSRVRNSVKDIAAELVRLYATRHAKLGYKFMPDTIWQKEFEDSFEFEETDDQLRAIEDVKADMESSKIMDRLICGDVGFGKTEVAIRAAFKAVQDGKQVAFLVPTTILAQQHYNTIRQRIQNFPINVAELSRFSTKAEQKKIIEEIKKGKMDIVVGTHRLISKDVEFKNLGLLIIDEEQRFGVSHKEKIKQLKQDVDVLTLSATPIPRTLHMSLTGIRDMSLLTEPPVERVPIQTYVMEYSKDSVKEAILREYRRGGQVYYVYNRTENIHSVANQIQEMLPDLNVAYAHGKMATKDLEQIMLDFIDGDIDVLVSTTIIETGMDIPNVNTIIIQDADRFGLSQLYQLRGRVGRADKTAYAFLMFKKDKLIKEVAENRLKAIRDFSDLGSGLKIAMRDMEIRGAGNVLGAEQSGHMEAVGYELYCKMLNEAVALLKGEHIIEDFETIIDLSIDGYIPSDYIKNEHEKLNMYKKISAISNCEEQDDIRSELEDRFGEIPKVTENLLEVALMKTYAHEAYVTEVSGTRSKFKIAMYRMAPVNINRLEDFLVEFEDNINFVVDSSPYFVYKPEVIPQNVKETRKTLEEFFDRMKVILKTSDEIEAEKREKEIMEEEE